MRRTIKIFQAPFELAEAMALELVNSVRESEKANLPLTIALSGGSTPVLLYTLLGDHFGSAVRWDHVHFFWVDERIVSPGNIESNFGMASSAFLQKADIPSQNIHRIKGENDPEKEVIRYADEINKYTRKRKGLPVFDIVLLGLGEDGHTASIFPGNEKLFKTVRICAEAVHPVSGQKRITLTGKVINNADNIYFLVAGNTKARVVGETLAEQSPCVRHYPASYVQPSKGRLYWYLDKEAGSFVTLKSA